MAHADTWPPEPFDIAAARFAEHDAWYAGDTAKLNGIYSGKGAAATHVHGGTPHRGGVIGSLSKMFWGTPVVAGENRSKMHIPVAADLATLSADLLFAEAPKIRYRKPESVEAPKAGEKVTRWEHRAQPRLDRIMASDETHAELLKAGEYSASLGGAYLAVVWDEDLADHVWIRAYASDCAIPRFQDGRLTAATLWTEYAKDRDVFRLLEEHTRGIISYTLHKGTAKELGQVVPLGTLAETVHYESMRTELDYQIAAENPEAWSDTVTVATGVDALAVVYFPNMLPQRDWRKLGVLANLGRSDYAGIEDLLDKIDQVWSSLLRDIDNGAGRITVPESWIATGDPGEGGRVDLDRQVYSGVKMLGTAGSPEKAEISQFEIRVDEHLATIDAIKREIASMTGYSPSHLGLKGQGGQKTATEVTADFTDSERTRDKKALYVKPALSRLAQVALGIDAIVFPRMGGEWVDELPDVEFVDVSQIDPEKNARTVQMMDAARAAATKTKVATLHPDWDEDDINEEVADILREQGVEADPSKITGFENDEDNREE